MSTFRRGRVSLVALVLVAGALGVAACGDGEDGPTTPDPQTFTFGPFVLAPGEESYGDCVSAPLGNTEPIYVNAVDLVTGSGFHHSNWFWVPETTFPGPDGVWNCDSRAYDEVVAGGAGGVLFAQSTQAVTERQAFAPGVVIPIPAHAKIVSGIHMLNAGDEPLTTRLELTVTPIAPDEVTTKLATMALQYRPLALPPRRKSSVTIECDVGDLHQIVIGTPIDYEVFYSFPHYHTLGRGYDLVASGGPGPDVTIASSSASVGEPLGEVLDPPFSLEGYTKLRFTCHFDNTTDRTVRWGLSAGEMCVWQGFTNSIYKWGGTTNGAATSTVVDDGEVVRFTHPCDLYGFPIVDP